MNGLKEEIDKYKADSEKLPSVQKELDIAKEAMANGDKSPYKVKYDAKVEEFEELKKEFDNYKADVDAKASHAKKVDAYKQLLKDAGVSEKRIDAIIKVSQVDDVEFDKEGNVTNAKELTKAIESEWEDFIVKKSEQGANTSNPPQNTGGSAIMTREEIMKIADTNERQKAWENFLENERK